MPVTTRATFAGAVSASMGPASENAGYADVQLADAQMGQPLQWVRRPRTPVMLGYLV